MEGNTRTCVSMYFILGTKVGLHSCFKVYDSYVLLLLRLRLLLLILLLLHPLLRLLLVLLLYLHLFLL